MRSSFVSFVIVSFFLLASTYAGMSLFGMNMQDMTSSGCPDQMCMPDSSADMGNLTCLTHCLSDARPDMNPPTTMVLSLVAILLVFLSKGLFLEPGVFSFYIQRWRYDIGKFLLHQHLSTVILRD